MIKVSTLIDLCFLIITLIIFSNLNGVVWLLSGITAAFSGVILVCCLIISYFLFNYKNLTLPHKALNVAFFSFLLIGSCTWFLFSHMYHDVANYYKVFRGHIPGVVLIFAIYKYILYAGNQGKLQNVLFLITILLLIVTFIVPLGVFTNIFTGVLKPLATAQRAAGLFASPNLAGVHANFTLVFVLFFILRSKRFYLLFIATIPVILYAAFLTFSKATIIISVALLVFFILYHIFFFTKIEGRGRRRFGVFMIAVAAGIVIASPHIEEYMEQLNYVQLKRLVEVAELAQGEVNEETTTDRSVVWNKALELIRANPILGYGVSCFHNLPDHKLGTHNTYLMIWGEGGIIAFAAFMIYVLTAFYRSLFWIREPSYHFLALSMSIIIFVQMYGAAHTGLSNSESISMTAVLLAIIELKKARKRKSIAEIDKEISAKLETT